MRRSRVPTRVGIDAFFNVAWRGAKLLTSQHLREGPPAVDRQYSFYALDGLERCRAVHYNGIRALRSGSYCTYMPSLKLLDASEELAEFYRGALLESLGSDNI